MKINYEFVLTEVGGEKMLVPTGSSSVRYKGIVSLNETAASMWKLLPDAETAEDVAKGISEEYDIEPENALPDVIKFIGKLRDAGIVE